jgi:hypothetical protein
MSNDRYGYVLIGVDPGKTTGLFLYSNRPRFGFLDRKYLFDEVTADDMPKRISDLIVKATDYVGFSGVHVAVERYIITGRTAKLSQQVDALEVTGMVKALARLHTSTPVRQYMKANLRFANDGALRKAGWYSSKLGHATDAARQAYALLKDVDYPEWLAVSNGAMMKFDDETKGR